MKEITIEEAEKIYGGRLDRRRLYATTDDGKPCESTGYKIFSLGKFTQSCSGCFETGDYMSGAENYPYDEKNHCYIGSGCDECGYTGKRRNVMWLPHSQKMKGGV